LRHDTVSRPESPVFDCAFDAANLLLHAMETVAVREKNGTLHIGRQALRDALYGMTDFPGVTGRLSCDEFGDCGILSFDIVRVEDPSAGFEGVKANIVWP